MLTQAINQRLQLDDGTRARKLRVRTFKVLPLCPETGVFEYIPDLVAIGDFCNSLRST